MSAKPHAENVANLRQRVAELAKLGAVGDDADMYAATLIQLLNESESKRQKHLAAAERLRQQAEREEGQAEGCIAMTSVIFNTLNGFINQANRARQEEQAREEEEKEKEEYRLKVEAESEPKPSPAKKKKAVKKKASSRTNG